MSKEFKISIIVNCFNGEKYLSRCLQSIINQTVNNWELIFFDNKSNDLSKEIFNKFNDKRFKYFSSTHFMKLYEARNEAVKNISGDFIAFLDCDDWWEPFHLENANPFFQNEHLGFYYSNAFNYYEKKKKFNLHKKSLPKKNVLIGKLQSILDFWGGPPFSIFFCILIKNKGNCKIHLSFYFWDKLLFWANTLQSRQGITLGRHNAVGA